MSDVNTSLSSHKFSQEDNDVDEFEDDEEIGEDEQVDDSIPEQGDMIGEKLLLLDFSLKEDPTRYQEQKLENVKYGGQVNVKNIEKNIKAKLNNFMPVE